MGTVFDELFGRESLARDPVTVPPQEGQVTRVTGDGVYFVVGDWDGGRYEFGPAKWARGNDVELTAGGSGDDAFAAHRHERVPQPGQLCLVVFVGPGIERPWIVGWW